MECGIGKCGACEMLVDGTIRRICITKVDDVKIVERIGDANAAGEKGVMASVPEGFLKDTQTHLPYDCSNHRSRPRRSGGT